LIGIRILNTDIHTAKGSAKVRGVRRGWCKFDLALPFAFCGPPEVKNCLKTRLFNISRECRPTLSHPPGLPHWLGCGPWQGIALGQLHP
jgi:hypothetical protein